MFYLSSRGSTATGWIANNLSLHPKIICFISSRTFPPVKPGESFPIHPWVKEILADKYIESLNLSEEACYKNKVFGSIHGYHGILAKSACEKLGGFFGYITRHPLERVHSCFIYDLYNMYYKKKSEVKNEEIFGRVKTLLNREKDFNINKVIKTKRPFLEGNSFKTFIYKKLSKNYPKIIEIYKNYQIKKKQEKIKFEIDNDYEESVLFVDHFNKLCKDFFSKDRILFDNCNNEIQGIKMEELIRSTEYFKKNLLLKIISDDDISNNYLNLISELKNKRIGVHRNEPIKSDQIWNEMPKVLKEIFLNNYDRFNIKEITSFFDYKINI